MFYLNWGPQSPNFTPINFVCKTALFLIKYTSKLFSFIIITDLGESYNNIRHNGIEGVSFRPFDERSRIRVIPFRLGCWLVGYWLLLFFLKFYVVGRLMIITQYDCHFGYCLKLTVCMEHRRGIQLT